MRNNSLRHSVINVPKDSVSFGPSCVPPAAPRVAVGTSAAWCGVPSPVICSLQLDVTACTTTSLQTPDLLKIILSLDTGCRDYAGDLPQRYVSSSRLVGLRVNSYQGSTRVRRGDPGMTRLTIVEPLCSADRH
ncbi:hypothetical protein RRG08_040727 [Elysia crispata]|uniref:Uncharacterized protein n=1 Tax=Elysia crispata TaxID=231223 RepID=A0AAE1BDC2_9GAST|nr:hypothetical protein RRG08_040727 [Elysia crispata]